MEKQLVNEYKIEGRNAVTEALSSERPIDKLYVQVYHCNRHEPTLSFEVDEQLAVSQVDEEFFEYLLKHRNASHKKMKVICDKLNKIIENKNKLAKIESDF